MTDANKAVKLGTDAMLAGITARMSDLEELRALDMQMAARHAAGEVLSDEEVTAHMDKTDTLLDELQKQIDAAKAARAAK